MTEKWTWWKHGIIYHIYVRSFYDSNGDGIGDLNGVTQKLDYLHDLGINAIWLSPINCSPMHDFGYDVSDYYEIDPIFGTKEDFFNLIKEAHKRNIHVIMDLVFNHTSHLHKWFLESKSSKNNDKSDWYIWHDGYNGKPPNNWKSSFAGSAWKWDDTRNQYYLHSFLKEQPDVNWRNPELKKAIFDVIKYWLDNGVDGFRLDVVNWFIKDEKLRNNPYYFKPFLIQKHKYDRNRRENHDIIKELRTVIDEYEDKMTVGEVFSLPPGNPELSASYLGNGENELHLAFDFSLMYRWWSARRFYKCIKRWYSNIPENGWPCYVLSNHDQVRSISRFHKGTDATKRAIVGATLLLTLKGTPFIYYGEEIGMKNYNISYKEILDHLGKKYWPIYYGRDPARTPMQWNSQNNAGFTDSDSTWLPVCGDYTHINMKDQKKDKYSLFHYYKCLISIRKEYEVLQKGKWIALYKGYKNIISYFRIYKDEKICVILNFSNKYRKFHIHDRSKWIVIFSTHQPYNKHFLNLKYTLSPYESTILKQI